jgi:hypothetical protein
MSHTVHMTGEFWFFPHGYLNGWANTLIQDAESVSAGAANYYRVSALLAVMSFEAYLNYVGERHIKDWPERKPWSKKLSLILEKCGLDSQRGEEPFSTLEKLFKYRNTLAHGRIAVNPLDYLDHGDGRVEGNHTGDPDWYCEFGNREQAITTLRAIRDSMLAIHKVADPHDNRVPWAIYGSGCSSGS